MARILTGRGLVWNSGAFPFLAALGKHQRLTDLLRSLSGTLSTHRGWGGENLSAGYSTLPRQTFLWPRAPWPLAFSAYLCSKSKESKPTKSVLIPGPRRSELFNIACGSPRPLQTVIGPGIGLSVPSVPCAGRCHAPCVRVNRSGEGTRISHSPPAPMRVADRAPDVPNRIRTRTSSPDSARAGASVS